MKIPDEWRRKHEETTSARVIVNYGIPIVFGVGLGVAALILFFQNLKSDVARTIPWRRFARWALWSLGAFIAVFISGDRIAVAMSQYNTAIPLKTMYGVLGITATLGGPFTFGATLLVFGMAWFFGGRAFGQERMPGWLKMPREYYRDALLIGLGGAAALLGLETLSAVAFQHWSTVHRYAGAAFGADFDAKFPAIAILAGAVQHSLLVTGLIAAIAGFLASYVRRSWLRGLIYLVAAISLVGGNWGDAADLTRQFITELIFVAVVVAGIRWIVRFNLLGYFLILAVLALLGGSSELLKQPDEFLRMNGYALVAALLVLLLWPLLSWMRPAGGGAVAQ